MCRLGADAAQIQTPDISLEEHLIRISKKEELTGQVDRSTPDNTKSLTHIVICLVLLVLCSRSICLHVNVCVSEQDEGEEKVWL